MLDALGRWVCGLAFLAGHRHSNGGGRPLSLPHRIYAVPARLLQRPRTDTVFYWDAARLRNVPSAAALRAAWLVLRGRAWRVRFVLRTCCFTLLLLSLRSLRRRRLLTVDPFCAVASVTHRVFAAPYARDAVCRRLLRVGGGLVRFAAWTVARALGFRRRWLRYFSGFGVRTTPAFTDAGLPHTFTRLPLASFLNAGCQTRLPRRTFSVLGLRLRCSRGMGRALLFGCGWFMVSVRPPFLYLHLPLPLVRKRVFRATWAANLYDGALLPLPLACRRACTFLLLVLSSRRLAVSFRLAW